MLPLNYKMISPYAFLAWLQSTFSAEETSKVGLNRTRWEPTLNSVTQDQDQDRKEHEKAIVRYMSTKTLLADYMEKQETIK